MKRHQRIMRVKNSTIFDLKLNLDADPASASEREVAHED